MDFKEETPKAPPTPAQPQPPEPFSFPVQLLEQWVEIPASERLTAPLSRQDIDHLIFGLLRSGDAQSNLHAAFVEWSNGRIDSANEKIAEFRRQNADSQNYIRQFFTALMVSALGERARGK